MTKHLGTAAFFLLFFTAICMADGGPVAAANALNNAKNGPRGQGGRPGGPGGASNHGPRTTPQGQAQMHRTMQSAHHVSQCAQSMRMNPMDTFRRTQYKSAMDDLNQNLKKLASEARQGNVAGQDIGQLQKQMAQTLVQADDKGKELIKQAIDSAKEDARSVDNDDRKGRGIRGEVREALEDRPGLVLLAGAAAGNSERWKEVADAQAAADKSATTTITPTTILSEVAGPVPDVAPAPAAEVQAVTAFRQMDVLLSPDSFVKPAEAAGKLIVLQAHEEKRGVRTLDAGSATGSEGDSVVGEPRDNEEKRVLSDDSTPTEAWKLTAEEQLLLASPNGLTSIGPVGEVERKIPTALRAGFASDGIWGAATVKPETLLARSAAMTTESSWDETIYNGGRFALLTIIVCASLTLLAFYLRSTFRAHRRDVDNTPKILPFTK